jgi:hypothetical protein
MVNRPLQLELIAPSASPEETAAIVTALERFMRAAPPAASIGENQDPWLRAAILEGVARDEESDMPNPWINT